MRPRFYWIGLSLAVLFAPPSFASPLLAGEPAPNRDGERPRTIMIIAGPKSHGPVGNGIHDYPWSAKLLKVMLDNSNVRDRVRVEIFLDGGPKDWSVLDRADAILIISDGRDGELYAEAPHFASEERAAQFARQMKRGCGFLTFHFSTFAPDKFAEQILSWSGGYFDWETDGKRQWYSAITTKETEIQLATPEHPVLRGVKPFRMREEFYYNLRFRPDDKSLKPIYTVPELPGREPDGRIVAWAREREDGGRGFGTTCGHFYDNWKNDQFRRTMLNALVWASGLEVPEDGVNSRVFTHAEITAALAGVQGGARAEVDEAPIRVLLPAGNDAHKWHNWEKTTVAIQKALERDPRIQVDVVHDIEELARRDLSKYSVIVQNYVNWHDPNTLSNASRNAFVRFLENGGGLVLPHFSASAFHFSLPKAEASDWPEYRKIARRVWNHHGQGDQRSGHDAFGLFTVEITELEHPITSGLTKFNVLDELYFRQAGSDPIEPLIQARSKVTGRDEPLAWTYTYGKGRIFQTLLGHSEKTYDAFEAREMIRRAVAWTANRKLIRLAPADDPASMPGATTSGTPPTNTATLTLAAGKFGQALDAAKAGVLIPGAESFHTAPLTVECWARLPRKGPYQILVAQETKASNTHWELFAMAGTGEFTAYLPGMQPDHVRTKVNICDDAWHFLSMQLEAERVRLYVDGKLVGEENVSRRTGKTVAGPLAIGRLAEGGLGCDGWIDEVRLSRGLRDAALLPTEPLPADDATLGLWRFDALTEKDGKRSTPDASKSGAAATAQASSSPPPATVRAKDHFGEEAVGFRWTESDSADNRWNQTNVGPFLASSLPIPDAGMVAKGLSIRLGSRDEAAVVYNTANGMLRAAWNNGFLKFDPARFGLISSPRLAGPVWFSSDDGPGWGPGLVQFRGLRLHGARTILEFDVGGTRVRESPELITLGKRSAIRRNLDLGERAEPLTATLVRSNGPAKIVMIDGVRLGCLTQAGQTHAVGVQSDSGELVVGAAGSLELRIPTGAAQRAVVLHWTGPESELNQFAAAVRAAVPADVQPWLQAGPRRWTHPVTTRGVLGTIPGAYQLDTLTLPFENPWNALLFCSGHDFFSNGDIALCTVHGDVWRVSGVDETLERLTWTRFATGLFQPLGLKIVKDKVHVLGRDQITRLHDENADGEADHYECFFNRFVTSTGGHDYVTCLETDSMGNFYFAHATQGVVRVAADGSSLEVLATGIRNPNGLSVGPSGLVTVAPQEGNWTPASAIVAVRPGGHYGFGGPKVTAERPLGYDPPLVWLPRLQDNSSGGQTWVTSERWGPFTNGLLHFSFGKCRMMHVLIDRPENRLNVTTLPDGALAAGVVDFPLDFDSGVMRGRFHPRDGQLFVSGLKGWVSSAVRDGCLQRVRYTGKPVDMPLSFQVHANGVALRFDRPLRKASVEDVGNYHVQRWNYRYSADYGSAEWKLSDRSQEGRDTVVVASATLFDDRRTIFLEIPDLAPAMQMAFRYSLDSDDGSPIRQTLNATIHSLQREAIEEARLARTSTRSNVAAEISARLKPGVVVARVSSADPAAEHLRLARLINFDPGSLSPNPQSTTFRYRGYLRVPLRGRYRFTAEGEGELTFSIHGAPVLSGAGVLARLPVAEAELQGGDNRIEVAFRPTGKASPPFRLLWSAEEFAPEPIPPTHLSHDPEEPPIRAAAERERGRELFEQRNCRRCHASPMAAASLPAHGEIDVLPPELAGLDRRVRREWLIDWLLDPALHREEPRMPKLLSDDAGTARQQAADLAAYLNASDQAAPPRPEVDDSTVVAGRLLFEDLGCIGCHRVTPRKEQDEYSRLSLRYVRRKFAPGALEAFLRNPHAHFPASRMPDFQLSAEEASRLTAYLLSESPADRPPDSAPLPGEAQRGAALFRDLGCRHCHATKTNETPAPAIRPLRLGASHDQMGGCLAENAQRRATAPDWNWSREQRTDLLAFLAVTEPQARTVPPAESISRLTRELRCIACHPRDLSQSVRMPALLEESERGLVPETLPNLTWTGEKLQTPWLERTFRGEPETRVRPWLRARMPAFPAYAAALARGLSAEHAAVSEHDPQPEAAPESIAFGNRLIQKEALDCRQCHGLGNLAPTGDKGSLIAQGINFSLTQKRIRYDFFQRFMLDPPRFDIGSRMPKLSADGRTTKVAGILDGDARRQFAAVWSFLRQSRESTDP